MVANVPVRLLEELEEDHAQLGMVQRSNELADRIISRGLL